MKVRKTYSVVAVIALAIVVPAMANPQPWPEAHSGSYLGVQIAAVTPQQASALKLQEPAGALITYVDQDGPACHAGLEENDVVVGFEGSKVEGPQQLQGLIHATPPQKTVTLTVVHNGQRKDVKVTLGSWNIMSHTRPVSAMNLAAPPPPRVFAPDLEVPAFTLLSSRHGLVVESLSPQLADFFGVPHGHGVLVRSVEAGSRAAAAGLKAGDVILKINNDAVHDMADWQRGMNASGTKVSISVWRDKREQNVTMSVPGPGDSSRFSPGDVLDFGTDTQLLREETQQMLPQMNLELQEMTADLGPSQKDLEQMRRDIDKAMKRQGKDAQKMARDLAKSTRPFTKDMKKMQSEMQKSMPSQKDLDKMERQIQQSMPSAKDIEKMRERALASLPTQQQMDEMRKQVEESMKNFTPEWRKQMEELHKQMEQWKFELPPTTPNSDDREEF